MEPPFDDIDGHITRLMDERHSREAAPFEDLIERCNRVEKAYNRASSQLAESWRLMSMEIDGDGGDVMKKIASKLDEAAEGDSKLHINFFRREKELVNLRAQNEALTSKLLEISEQRAAEMNDSLLSRRIVDNLPKYKSNRGRNAKIPQMVGQTHYSPHASDLDASQILDSSTQILDSYIYENFLMTAANDGIVTVARIEVSSEGNSGEERKVIHLEQNAAVQACHLTMSQSHNYTGGRRLLLATCSDSSVRVYSLPCSLDEGHTTLTHFTTSPSRPSSCCFLSPSRLALGTNDGNLRVYDFSRGEETPRRDMNIRLSEGSALLSLSLSFDSSRLAVADSYGRVHVLHFAIDHQYNRITSNVIMDEYDSHQGHGSLSTVSVAFHPYNSQILALTKIGSDSIDIIDVESGRIQRTLTTSKATHLTSGGVWDATWPAVSIVAGVAGGSASSLAIWDTSSPLQLTPSSTPVRTLPTSGGPITGAQWGPHFLAVGTPAGNFSFYT